MDGGRQSAIQLLDQQPEANVRRRFSAFIGSRHGWIHERFELPPAATARIELGTIHAADAPFGDIASEIE